MSNKAEFEELVSNFKSSLSDLEEYLEGMSEDVVINAEEGTIDLKSYKAVIVDVLLKGIDLKMFDNYTSSLAKDLKDE